jgi:hypothetical protein
MSAGATKFNSFLGFIRASYFRLVFIFFIVLALYIQSTLLSYFVKSEQLAEFIKNFHNHELNNYFAISRIVLSIIGNGSEIVASAMVLLLMREFLLFNTQNIYGYTTNELDAVAAKQGQYYAKIFSYIILGVLIYILARPYFTFTGTFLSGTFLCKNSPAYDVNWFSSVLSFPAKCSPNIGNYGGWSALAINLFAISCLSLLFFQILRGRAQWLKRYIIPYLFFAISLGVIIHVSALAVPLFSARVFGPFALVMIFHAVVLSLFCAFLYRRGIVPLALFVFTIAVSNGLRPEDKTRFLTNTPAVVQRSEDYAAKFACRSFGIRAGQPIPVFIVTAEGGGYYAAYFSSRFMSHLTNKVSKKMPWFKDHIYALSGVSGGGLGMTLFFKALHHDKGRQSEITKKFFEYDFLTPLIASIAFVDSRSLIESTLFGLETRASRNRAVALELAFEEAWGYASEEGKGHGASNKFEEDFLRLQSDEIPVFLNGTVANNGLPVLIAPLQVTWKSADLNPFYNFSELTENHIATSTAVGISARFPYVIPTAPILPYKWGVPKKTDEFCNPGIANARKPNGNKKGEPKECKLAVIADGGYFDNSGMATALVLGRDFNSALSDGSDCNASTRIFKIHILRIRTSDALDPLDEISGSTSELSAPLWAVYNARAVHREQLNHIATGEGYCVMEASLFSSMPDTLSGCRKVKTSRCTELETLPITWFLSDEAKTRIEERAACEASNIGDEILHILNSAGTRSNAAAP